ncbi:MAG: RodZ domain-containing protein [Marmoricola sp.]
MKTTVNEVEVRRNAGLAALVGAVASALAIAYVARAISHGGAFPWVLALVLGVIGVTQLVALVDSRTPLLVADSFGIRLRLGREWRGLPWESLEQVVVEPRTSVLHDGRLVVAPRFLNRALEGLDARARRQVAVAQKLYGAPLAVPLGMTTRVSTASLVEDLAALAAGRAAVVELAGYVAEPVLSRPPEPPRPPEPSASLGESAEAVEPRAARLLGGLGTLVSRVARGRAHDVDAPAPEAVPAGPPAPSYAPATALREARPAARADVHMDTPVQLGATAAQLDLRHHEDGSDGALPEGAQLRRGDDSGWVTRSTELGAGDSVVPIARPGSAVAPLVIDDFEPESAIVPVVGPRVAAARTRLGFDIDTLSTRTRIRPHVLEAIEVDDFAPCGGDFYARGHLRTLARVLGMPPEDLVAEFDAHYASAPINARKVFEAELATGMSGGIRATFGGPRWGLMMGVVLCLVLAWGVARLFTGAPAEVTDPAPGLSGSAGLSSQHRPITSSLGAPVLMSVKAPRGAANVLVRDHSGRILYSGHLKRGGHHQLYGVGPFTVRASAPAAVDVWVDGKPKGAVGVGNQLAHRTFG